MKKMFIALAAVVLVCATSCSGLRTFQQVQGVSVTPDFVRLDINFDNMQPLGETTISIETRTYLGFSQFWTRLTVSSTTAATSAAPC